MPFSKSPMAQAETQTSMSMPQIATSSMPLVRRSSRKSAVTHV